MKKNDEMRVRNSHVQLLKFVCENIPQVSKGIECSDVSLASNRSLEICIGWSLCEILHVERGRNLEYEMYLLFTLSECRKITYVSGTSKLLFHGCAALTFLARSQSDHVESDSGRVK